MLHRLNDLESSKVLANSGTELTDINVRDPITALWVRFSATNGATSNKAATAFDCLSKIEIIDGSQVLVSLTGYEAAALAAYQLGYMPYSLVDEVAGDEQTAVFPIMFGRYFGDPAYAFHPAKFQNPQVRYQWNLAAVNTVGAAGFVSGTGRLTLTAEILEAGPEPVGMIQSKEHYAFTPAASGITYIDLPVDYPYRALMIRSFLAGYYITQPVSHVKLNCDQGKWIPIDHDLIKLIEYWSTRHAPFSLKQQWWCVNGDTLYCVFKQDEAVGGGPCGGHDHTFQYPNVGYGQAAVDLRTGGSAETGLHQIQAVVTGWAPWGCVYAPLGEPTDPADWLPAASFRSMRLELTNGLASSAASVVVEQVRPY